MLEIGFMYKGEENAVSWCIEDGFNPADHYKFNVCSVIQVEADGDELAHIRRCFKNLPGLDDTGTYANARRLSWFGDDARFIIYHLGKP